MKLDVNEIKSVVEHQLAYANGFELVMIVHPQDKVIYFKVSKKISQNVNVVQKFNNIQVAVDKFNELQSWL